MRTDAQYLTPKKKEKFLEQLALLGGIGKACEAIGIARRTVYDWREKDAEFDQAIALAYQTYGEDILEREADRRGVEGVLEPVFHKGEVCGEVRKYSDTLLIFRMKGVMPEKYKDRTEVSGLGGGPLTFNVVYEEKKVEEEG